MTVGSATPAILMCILLFVLPQVRYNICHPGKTYDANKVDKKNIIYYVIQVACIIFLYV